MAMSRQRMLPPDIFTDELLITQPMATRMTAVGLRLNADDRGRESANPMLLKAALWPLEAAVTVADIEDHLLTLDDLGHIALYNAGGRLFYVMAEWPSVSHPVESRHPAPPPGVFQKTSGGAPENFSAEERERGREREREWESESTAGLPPSPFCKIHQPSGTTNNCRHCGTARLAHDQWLRMSSTSLTLNDD